MMTVQKADKGIKKMETEEKALARIVSDWVEKYFQREKKGKWK